MITNTLLVSRQLDEAQKQGAMSEEKAFLFKRFARHLRENHPTLFKNFQCLEPQLNRLAERSVILAVERSTLADGENTKVLVSLDEKSKLRGEMTLYYNRLPLNQYFNLTEVNDPVILPYNEWLSARSAGKETFLNYLHRVFFYRLGMLFSHDGAIVLRDVEQTEGEQIKTLRGLIGLVPSHHRIEQDWAKLRAQAGELDHGNSYQRLTLFIRIVANGHLFIDDGELLLPIELEIPLVQGGRG